MLEDRAIKKINDGYSRSREQTSRLADFWPLVGMLPACRVRLWLCLPASVEYVCSSQQIVLQASNAQLGARANAAKRQEGQERV